MVHRSPRGRVSPGVHAGDQSQEAYPITVNFFDQHGSVRLSYGFWLVEPGKLFLKQVDRWEYPDDGKFHGMSESTVVETILWEEPDGVVRRRIHDGNTVHAEDYRDVPSDANWEPYPSFGDFASIAREDRDQPARQAGASVRCFRPNPV